MVKDFNFRHFSYPYRIWKIKRFLNQSNNYSKDELKNYQNSRLRYFIRYVYKNVPYYEKLFNDNNIDTNKIITVEDLKFIPPLTKELIRENFNELQSKEFGKYNPVLTQTSGSTGTPLKYYLDKNINSARFAYYWHIWGWTGYKFGQKWASIRGSVFEDDCIYKYARPLNALYISSFKLTEKNSNIILKELVKFGPKMLRGYPSSLYEFAKFVDNNKNLKNLELNNIVTDSETLLNYQRDYIQNIFQAKVFDSYGHWEGACLIAECEFQIKHHLMEYGILELLDKNNNLSHQNDLGEITVTGLYNKTMPLIRYKTRDLAIRNTNRLCKCKREHDIVIKIDGRIEDIIVTPDGRHIGRLDAAFKFNKGFDFAQIIQNDLNSIDVYIVKNNQFDEHEEKILDENLKDRVGHTIKINYHYKDKIEAGSNGKTRLVINHYLQNN